MTIKDKVLVVEDEKSISGFIRAILTANGFDVIVAHSGSEAFSMISSHCPDLVVLDLGLPDMDGMEIIETVRQWTQIPIVVVSARSYERDKVQAHDGTIRGENAPAGGARFVIELPMEEEDHEDKG